MGNSARELLKKDPDAWGNPLQKIWGTLCGNDKL
jgi:hypothetical protein